MKSADEATNPLDDISVVPEPSAEVLNERQQIDYRSQREQCLDWLLVFGKDPKQADGYAHTTVKCRSHRMDQFYRWVWSEENGYTSNVTHDHADAYLRDLARREQSNAHKDNCRKALQMLYKWREHEHGLDEWNPELSFSTGHKTTAPRDYLTREERGLIREAALESGGILADSDFGAEGRGGWKADILQRFGKPKTGDGREVRRGEQLNAPRRRLARVRRQAPSHRGGVGRAVASWVDVENAGLRTPDEEPRKTPPTGPSASRTALPGRSPAGWSAAGQTRDDALEHTECDRETIRRTELLRYVDGFRQ